ncbi:putative metal-binding motif-containing protein [Corallococcus macrosporus]|uniref:Metal-binding motif-containing protein n=1 Tax=Corallococcus macrosporus TaxID=35 RepID=A0ABS3DL36_9BACT|nr:putative metal-binding motif-containing protein [Corallococcus macrosporus]MBN8232049.1 putative metal-binding motif-containing protein [Corallococcus macrosporus]
MRLICLLTCVVLLSACRMKDPAEGVLRLTVKYPSYTPQCLRVEVGDGHNQVGTDLPSSQAKDPDAKEVQVAMVRKPGWGNRLNVKVTSFAAFSGIQCAGSVVEAHEDRALDAPPGKSIDWTVTLQGQQAADADGDGFVPGMPGVESPDCDDTRADVHPGAEEKCDTAVDFDCDGRKACADPDCSDKTCTDGDLCTQGKRCVGVGVMAECGGGEPKCKQTGGPCQSAVRCEASTGECIDETVDEGTACDPGDKCVNNGRCTADKRCVGDVKTCNTPLDAQCQESTGTCNSTNGLCAYAPKPVTTSCVDGNVCNDSGFCNGSGACNGTPTPCPPKECNSVAGCTRNASCIYAPDTAQLNLPCSEDNSGAPRVCRADGQCVAFPYTPANFDPNAIPGGQIGELRTTGAVVFDTDTRTWTPSAAGPNVENLTIRTVTQAGGAPEALLIPVRALVLGGELRIVGSRPVILAVYGDVALNHDILASGRIVNGAPVPGAGGTQQCGTSTGKNGTFSGGEGGGGGGAGGATAGAIGGRGYDNGATQGDAGAQQASVITPLLGGCAGGSGAGMGGTSGGLGGAGGGALQLSVARTLTLGKALSVSGSGGLGGQATVSPAQAAGGGGGGSGGRMVLEAFQINLSTGARLTANGGGGGQGGGAGSGSASNGANGTSGSETSGSSASGGTGGSTSGGAGGSGGTSSNPTSGENGTAIILAEGAGGGGGGAAGSIYLRSIRSCAVNAAAVVSPPATGGCTLP